jgi:RNA polymerase sigma-32 factor
VPEVETLGGDASLNTPVRDESESGDWQDWLVDESPSQERVLLEKEELERRRQALGEALTVLNKRERHIFEARRLAEKSATLEKLAEKFGISRERVRQIEVRAFEKVRKAVGHRFAAMDRPGALAVCRRRVPGSPLLRLPGRLIPSHHPHQR